MKVYNFKQLKQALKTSKTIYIMQDMETKGQLWLNRENVKIIGVLNDGKLPVINFKYMDCMKITGNRYVIKNLIFQNSIDCGLRIKDSHNNTIVNCIFRYNNNSGLSITAYSSNNTVVNCYSYMNCDYKDFGKSADGFSCKLQTGGGNKFINCYSFMNSDDGFDNYDNHCSVYYVNCIAWKNGDKTLFDESISKSYQGNGNGFKLASKHVKSEGYRYVNSCIAFDNNMKGFDKNNGEFKIDIKNCIAFNNSVNYKLENTKKLIDENNMETDNAIINTAIRSFCDILYGTCENNKIY